MTRMATIAHLETAIIELEYEKADIENAKEEDSEHLRPGQVQEPRSSAKASAELDGALQAAELAVAILEGSSIADIRDGG